MDASRLALNSQEALGRDMDHKVVRMALSEWQQDGKVSLDQGRQDHRFCCVALESSGHGIKLKIPPERTYARLAHRRGPLKLASKRP